LSAINFATQVVVEPPANTVLTPELLQLGAPQPHLPPSFAMIPDELSAAVSPVTAEEMAAAAAIRSSFVMEGWSAPYMNDIIRAMRLVKGKHSYLEVGIFDRGNLAYVSSLLADDAIIIGVDIVANERDEQVRRALKPSQTYISIIGDSRAPETFRNVAAALGGRKLEAAFIDGAHDAWSVMSDYAKTSALIADDGVIMFHDSMWEGVEKLKGVADALSEIDRLDPVYLVATDHPPYRFMRPLFREALWGVVGVIFAKQRYCARAGTLQALPPPVVTNVPPAWATLRRKDAIMREMFDGMIVALRPDIICDIGCFNGDESARFQRLAPTANIYAFEANRRNIDEFIVNRTDMSHVKLEYAAVCDVDGEVTFNVLEAEAKAGDWRRAAGSLRVRSDDTPYKSVTVPAITLDTYFADAIARGDTFVLWIDVEGALERVFAGARRTLQRTLFIRAEVERKEFWRDQKTADDLMAIAGEAGFIALADSWTPEAFEQSDILFINKSWLEFAAASRLNLSRPISEG
jgi:FkbM family methyltransferase